MATDEDNGRNESEHWTKDEIGVTTKLALIASWTHGRIAQSVRASEPNSVAAGSNLTSCQLFVADFEVGKDELWLGPRYFAHCNNNSTVFLRGKSFNYSSNILKKWDFWAW